MIESTRERTTVVKMTADKNEKSEGLFMISPSLSGEVPSRLQSIARAGATARLSTNFGLARAIGRYRGRPVGNYRKLFGFEPVVTASMTISVTNLLSGSINRTRSGQLHERAGFFASGT